MNETNKGVTDDHLFRLHVVVYNDHLQLHVVVYRGRSFNIGLWRMRLIFCGTGIRAVSNWVA